MRQGRGALATCFLLLHIVLLQLAVCHADGPVALFGEWSVFRIFDKKRKEFLCFMMSIPKERYDDFNHRGESFFSVINSAKNGEVEVYLSYGQITKSEITRAEIDIAKRKFPIFTYDDRAWAFNYFDDRNMIELFKNSVLFSVEIEYTNGKHLIDVYSLSGFSEAYQELLKICN
jgi:hypothetical protein